MQLHLRDNCPEASSLSTAKPSLFNTASAQEHMIDDPRVRLSRVTNVAAVEMASQVQIAPHVALQLMCSSLCDT